MTANSNNAPFHVIWSITSDCNMRCAYCRGRCSDEATLDAQNVDQCLRMLRKSLPPSRHLAVTFTGGEPTLRPNILFGVQHLRDKWVNMSLRVQTNGTFSHKAAYQARLAGAFEQIMVSIDAPRGHALADLRIGWDRNEIWQNIAALCMRKHGTSSQVGLVVTVYKANLPLLHQLVEDASAAGVDWIAFQPLRATERDGFAHQSLSASQLSGAVENLRRAGFKWHAPHIDTRMLYWTTCMKHVGQRALERCGAGREFVYVTPSLMVLPCCQIYPREPFALCFAEAMRRLQRGTLHRFFLTRLRREQPQCCLQCLYYDNVIGESEG